MEELTVDYVLEALREMGWDATAGERVEAGELAGRLGVCAMHGRLFDRLLAMLCEAGVLEPASGGWRVVVPGSRPAAREHRARMLASCPQAAVELEVLDRCGTGLAAVLRGAEQGLQSLLPDADLSLLTRLYEDAPFARVMNEALADVVAALAAGRRRLAVLEVGAGTGASTAWLLPRLGEDAAYTFSDIGPLFLKRARERFVADPRLAFQTFDLERDPAEQSLPLHGFDLVIAANVLHATCNLRASIDHVTRLLAPGGALVALETTAQQRWVDLFAGFAGGWWRFSDQDLRPDHPLLEPSAWRRLLEERGFAEVAVLEPRWHGQAMVARPAILIADGAPVRPGAATTAPGEPAVLVPAPPPGQPAVGALAEAPVEVWTDLLAATPAALRRRRLEELLTAEVGAVLELARHQWPEADLGLFELGMDSLTAIELKTRLQRRLGLVLPSSLIFDHPSVRALAGFLLGCVADLARPPAAVEDPPAGGADDAAAVDGGAGEPAAADGGLQVVLERELEALEELLARNGGPRHA
jgi:SAM-dependent methyltransferase